MSVYRDVEFKALQAHDFRRFEVQITKSVDPDQDLLFTPDQLHQTRSMEAQTSAEKETARAWAEQTLRQRGPQLFKDIWPEMLELYALKKTDAKDVIVELSNQGVIQNTWRLPGSKRRKPDDGDWIQCVTH